MKYYKPIFRLRSKGYTKIPKGYEVDHIQPLSKVGKDDPSNMQLLTKQQWKTNDVDFLKNILGNNFGTLPL